MGEYSAHTPDAGGGHAALADERGTGRTGLTAPMLGFGCGMDEEGQVVVTCVLQGSPAAYCGQVGIGDVIEAIDSRMVSSLQQLSDTASGPEDSLVALELRRKGDSHSESLHLMRQTPRDASDVGDNHSSERAGMGARVVHDVRGMRVCDLYEGSSSYWSTLKIDDIVCAVDGQDIRHGPPTLVLQLTNGSIGTGMCLHVIRKESSDDEIAGALSARGLGGGPSAHVSWKDAKDPELKINEKLIRVHVVRSRPLADSSLARALAYRANVVDLLQKRIERALLDSHSSEAEEKDIKETMLEDLKRSRGVGNSSGISKADMTLGDVAISSGIAADAGFGQADVHKNFEMSNMSERSWASEKLDSQLARLQEKHDDEVRKLQGQIADLASVIQSERPGSHVDIHSGNDAHNLQKGLMECVEKMRLQQQEEKKSMISLFQRHCQETMASQERLAEVLHGEIMELREKEGETLDFKQRVEILLEKVEDLNLNNVLLGNIPRNFTSAKALETTDVSGYDQTTAYGKLSKMRLGDPKQPPTPVLAMSRLQPAGTSLDVHLRLPDPPVGVSITISADFNRVQKHEKRFSDDLINACSWCLQAAAERFVYCRIERGSVIAKFNIIPDPSGMDPRPCKRLAEELAAQVSHPHSPVRKAPVTKPATKVVIHQPMTPEAYSPAHTQLQPVYELPVDNVAKFSEEDLSETEPEISVKRPAEEEWSEEQKQEQLSAMNRRLEEMDAFVSNLAASVPVEATGMTAANAPSIPTRTHGKRTDRVSNSYPPEEIPFKNTYMKSVMDLSVEESFVEEARDDDKAFSSHHKAHMQASSSGKEAGYRRLPPSSAVELESVLSRLEHSNTSSAKVKHSPPQDLVQMANARATNDTSRQDSSRIEDSRQISSSRAYAPTPNEFTSSFVMASSPTSAWKMRNANLSRQITEKGTFSPGSESSMNVSKRSPSPSEPKRWRVLPQWNEDDSDSRATPRSIATPLLQSGAQLISARALKEPQTLLQGERPSTTIPTFTASQRGNSPNRRRRQYARSDSSSDDERGTQQHFTPLSSARSDRSKPNEAQISVDQTARRKSNAILNADSDSDEEVRVRASDLPVRRLVNQRFQQ